MRPASIISFERFFLGGLAVDALASILALGTNIALLKANPATASMGGGTLIAGLLLYVAFGLLLWFLVTRKRSVAGKWLVSIWFIVATCLLALSLFNGQFFGLPIYLGWIAYGLRAKATSDLFKPDADAWFAKS